MEVACLKYQVATTCSIRRERSFGSQWELLDCIISMGCHIYCREQGYADLDQITRPLQSRSWCKHLGKVNARLCLTVEERDPSLTSQARPFISTFLRRYWLWPTCTKTADVHLILPSSSWSFLSPTWPLCSYNPATNLSRSIWPCGPVSTGIRTQCY